MEFILIGVFVALLVLAIFFSFRARGNRNPSPAVSERGGMGKAGRIAARLLVPSFGRRAEYNPAGWRDRNRTIVAMLLAFVFLVVWWWRYAGT